ncbi:MAG TPA: hypothetical protein VG164_06885 [Trebonia sp.]|nr:hypothetical protein [Trebonia sp.]
MLTDQTDEETATAGTAPRIAWRARLLWGAGLVLIGAGLFTLYVRQSHISAFNSDGGGNVLQAWAMLHGNPLLRGWWVSDVSFYTTELPEYVIVTAIRGITPDVVHICGALTYTLTVLLAALVARGRDKGRPGIVRAALAAGILLAPGILGGTPVLLENPDHAGTAVPVLLLLLVLDRWAERWPTAVAVCVLLAWTQVADQLTLVAATAPVAIVAVVRLGQLAVRRRPRAEFGYDTLLVVAAGVSVGLARLAEKALRHFGGFVLRPLPGKLLNSPSQVPHSARVMGQTILLLFGAQDPGTRRAWLRPIAYFHWIGLALVVVAFAVALATFFARRQDRVTQTVVVAALALLAAGILGNELPSLAHAHEVAVLAPFGAVLAGRVLPGLLPAGWRQRGWRPGRVLLPVLGAWLACLLAALCYAATWSPLPPGNQALATWLVSHGYQEGLATYWQAASTTVATGGKVTVAAVSASGSSVRPWEMDSGWYNPATHRADFVVSTQLMGGLSVRAARKDFGAPAHEYHVGEYVILVYKYNLLTRLRGRSFPGKVSGA